MSYITKSINNHIVKIFVVLFSYTTDINADWSALNMTRGVTGVSNEVFELHMLIFWICVAIGVVVVGVMFSSMDAHTKKKNPVASTFHERTKVKNTWSIFPSLK